MSDELEQPRGLMGPVVRAGKWLSLSKFTVNGMVVVLCPTAYVVTLWLSVPERIQESLTVFRQAAGVGRPK